MKNTHGGSGTPVDRYDLAARAGQNGLWDWDLTTSRIHYSPEWASLFGCAGAEFSSTLEEWFRRIHPEDLASVQSAINAHLAQGAAQFEIRHRMIHQDGCYRWMSCQGVITRDDTGRAIRVSGLHVDITAEKVVDSLTGLPNRILLMDRLTRSIQKARKSTDFLFAVLILDLDLFESGIDKLQTTNTDSLIIAAARRLETSLRAEDASAGNGRAHLIARSVGEEFIILLDRLSALVEAKKIAELLLKEILAPFEFNGREVFLSPSIGIAISATEYRNAEEALRDADTALYRAKAFGKSRCEVFDTAVLESTRNRDQMEQDLEEALSRNQFLVFYQPILSLSTNRILGFEALVRWNHPSRGMIAPLEFIPAAEKSGFIIPLSRWILQEACRQLKIWKQDSRVEKKLWVSVNLSGTQFMQPSLAKEIREILFDLDLDASGLMLELTESAVMENPEAARSLLMQLRVMGARIGLDDFGTGYSSLAYLSRFPLDFLKIDHSFIKNIETGNDTVEIVRTIIALARQLGLHVIAEGIENSKQLELLRSLQCEYGQGFWFSKAVDSGKALSLLLDAFAFAEDSGSPRNVESELNPSAAVQILSPRLKRNLTANRKYILVALAAIILGICGILASRLNRLSSPPASHESLPPTASEPAKVEQPAPSASIVEKVSMPEIQKSIPATGSPQSPAPSGVSPARPNGIPGPKLQKEPLAAAIALKSPTTVGAAKSTPKEAQATNNQKESLPAPAILPRLTSNKAPELREQKESPATIIPTPAAVPKNARKTGTQAAYELPVVHDHVLGSCKGVLKFESDGVSFISEKGKDSFYFKYPEYSYALEHEHLIIKTGTGTFRFKSTGASNKEANRSQLSDFYRKISRLYQDSSSTKAAGGR
jgi:diguanylate cyclase (GGDEF)-like protein